VIDPEVLERLLSWEIFTPAQDVVVAVAEFVPVMRIGPDPLVTREEP
jgi:hypothetical protein